MLDTPPVSAMRGNRAASASLTRLNAAATRFCAAMTSGRRSSSSDGNPAGTVAGSETNSVGAMRSAAGYRPSRELQRAQGLLERELHLSKAVAIGLQIEARDGDVEVAPDSDLQPLRGQSRGAS